MNLTHPILSSLTAAALCLAFGGEGAHAASKTASPQSAERPSGANPAKRKPGPVRSIPTTPRPPAPKAPPAPPRLVEHQIKEIGLQFSLPSSWTVKQEPKRAIFEARNLHDAPTASYMDAAFWIEILRRPLPTLHNLSEAEFIARFNNPHVLIQFLETEVFRSTWISGAYQAIELGGKPMILVSGAMANRHVFCVLGKSGTNAFVIRSSNQKAEDALLASLNPIGGAATRPLERANFKRLAKDLPDEPLAGESAQPEPLRQLHREWFAAYSKGAAALRLDAGEPWLESAEHLAKSVRLLAEQADKPSRALVTASLTALAQICDRVLPHTYAGQSYLSAVPRELSNDDPMLYTPSRNQSRSEREAVGLWEETLVYSAAQRVIPEIASLLAECAGLAGRPELATRFAKDWEAALLDGRLFKLQAIGQARQIYWKVAVQTVKGGLAKGTRDAAGEQLAANRIVELKGELARLHQEFRRQAEERAAELKRALASSSQSTVSGATARPSFGSASPAATFDFNRTQGTPSVPGVAPVQTGPDFKRMESNAIEQRRLNQDYQQRYDAVGTPTPGNGFSAAIIAEQKGRINQSYQSARDALIQKQERQK